MTSKILFVVLIGCAVAFASPIKDRDDSEEEVFEGMSKILEDVFGKLLETIGESILGTLQKAFDETSNHLDTERYKEAVAELQDIVKKVYGDSDEPNVGEENKKVIESELKKVAAAFQDLVQAALEKIKNHSDEKVDATEFKKAVDNLKTVVDKIYAN